MAPSNPFWNHRFSVSPTSGTMSSIGHSTVWSTGMGTAKAVKNKVFENKVRRTALRRGYRLERCRRRDTEAVGYGGYVLINTRANDAVELGKSTDEFAASL